MNNIIRVFSLLVLVASVDVVEGDFALLEYVGDEGKIKYTYVEIKKSPCELKEGTKVFLDKKTKEIIQCQ